MTTFTLPVEDAWGQASLHPPRGQRDDLYAVVTPLTDLHTGNRGGYVWLFEDFHLIAYRQVMSGYAEYDERCAEAIRGIAPWATTLGHLARADRIYAVERAVHHLMQAEGDAQDRDRWVTRMHAYATPEELSGAAVSRRQEAGERIGEAILARLCSQGRDEHGKAEAALPPADSLPAFDPRWSPWGMYGSAHWLARIGPLVFARAGAADTSAADRDAAIRWGIYTIGHNKATVHRMSGIARTTIDRVLSPASDATA